MTKCKTCQLDAFNHTPYCVNHLVDENNTYLEEEIFRILVDHLGVSLSLIHKTSLIEDNLGADSMDAVEICMAFEEEFGIEIYDDEVSKIETVADAINTVRFAVQRFRHRASFIEINENHSNNTNTVRKLIKYVVYSDLFSDYILKMGLDKAVILKVLEDHICDHVRFVTTVPDFNQDGDLVCVHIIFLTDKTLTYLKINNGEINIFSENISRISIMVGYFIDKNEVKSILVKSYVNDLLEVNGVKLPLELIFQEDYGITGAKKFIKKFFDFRRKI